MSACDTCANRNKHCVPGSGPVPARVMLVGAYPGAEEGKHGTVCIGRMGKELDGQYLRLAGLFREQVYVTNAYKCLPEGKPDEDAVLACAREWLPQELEAVRPEVVVLMGGDACLLDPSIDLERHHGFPRMGELFGHPAILFPTYLPAAGLHDTEWMTPLREDFGNLGRVLRGELDWVPQDRIGAQTVYRLAAPGLTDLAVRSYWLALDTESVQGKPFCVTASDTPGQALLVLAENRRMLRVLAQVIEKQNLLVILHHGKHDLPILASLDIHPRRWTDTMIRAYHLGLPQSLKVLAYRLCGMEMQEYQELVAPYAQEAMLEYLMHAHDCLAPLDEFLRRNQMALQVSGGAFQPSLFVVPDEDIERLLGRGENALSVSAMQELAGIDSGFLAHMASVRRRVARLINDCGEHTVNPWRRWESWPEEEREMLVQVVGELPPVPSIDRVPRELAVPYACRDADAAGRVHLELVRRAREQRRQVCV